MRNPLLNKFSSIRRANLNKTKLKLKGQTRMPKLSASKEEVTGQPPVPAGIYDVICKGFKPKTARKKDSVNLNPQLEIINHAEFNNRKLFDSLNTKAKWTWKPFFACMGVEYVETPEGGIEFPGNFDGPDKIPEQWKYSGPLMGAQGKVEVEEIAVVDPITQMPSTDSQGNTSQNRIKRYIPQGE